MIIQEINISNFRGIKERGIRSDGRPLYVHGENGVGKTSLCMALQLALSGQGVETRKAKFNAHCGIKTGYYISLILADGKKIHASPSGVENSDGINDDAVAVGLAKISRMKPKERLAHYIEITGESTLKNTDRYFNAIPDSDEAKGEFLRLVDTHAKAERSGENKIDNMADYWDLFSNDFSDKLRIAKRDWHAITGENYGSEKALNWRPSVLPITEQRSVSELSAALNTARNNAARSVGRMAALEDERKTLRAAIDSLQSSCGDEACNALENFEMSEEQEAMLEYEAGNPTLESADKIWKINLQNAQAELNRLVEAKQREILICPNCDASLIKSVTTKGTLVMATAVRVEGQIDGQIEDKQNEIGRYQRSINSYLNICKMTDEVSAKKNRIAEIDADLDGDVVSDTHTENPDTLAVYLDASRKMARASELASDCKRLKIICDACAPTGIRKLASEKAIGELNDKIVAVCVRLKFPTVITLHSDGDISIEREGPHGYATTLDYASESESWVADVCYQVVVAEMTGARCMVIDKADILSVSQRTMTLNPLMASNGGNVVVAATDDGGLAPADDVAEKVSFA